MITGTGDKIFRPSWIDQFNHWVEGLRVKPWIFYTLLGAMLILIQLLFLWLDSGSFVGDLLPVIIFNGLAVPYLLAMVRLLDNQALKALTDMRPVLTMSDNEFSAAQIRIAAMPFLAPLLAGLATVALTAVIPLVAREPARYAALQQLSMFSIVFHLIDKSSAFLFGVVLYHTIRQLMLVQDISANYIHINLFQLRPAQAFSRLTASTALGLLLFIYGWMFINPELLADPIILSVSLLFTALALLVFVAPLWGMHRSIVAEKEKALQEIELQFQALFAEFNAHIVATDLTQAERLNGTIMSLEIQHSKIDAVPTWPWRSETARIMLTAVALPILLMLVQFLVQRAFWP